MADEFELGIDRVKSRMKDGSPLFFLHVRHHTDWDTGLFKAYGALCVPDDEVEKHLDEIPRDRTVIVYSTCPGDDASTEAAKVLQRSGWNDVHPLRGGFAKYLQEGLPVQNLDEGRIVMKKLMLL